MAAPTSQKNKPIGAVLWDNKEKKVIASAYPPIRPADLSRVQPSRSTIVQTLGGAWADVFGEGINQINVSGNTGWLASLNSNEDGAQAFVKLRNTVFSGWHKARQRKITRGLDPDSVQLIWNDTLHETADVVIPVNFVLRRNKSSPLLYNYTISMAVLGPVNKKFPVKNDPIDESVNNRKQKYDNTLTKLDAHIDEFPDLASKTISVLPGDFQRPMDGFLGLTESMLGAVREAAIPIFGAFNSINGPVLALGTSLLGAGRNLFAALTAPLGIAQEVFYQLQQTMGVYQELYCLLRNGFSLAGLIPDFASLLGSSNCSSVGGGGPPSIFSGVNVFESIYASAGSSAIMTVSERASSQLSFLNTDPLSFGSSFSAQAPTVVEDIASGVTLTPSSTTAEWSEWKWIPGSARRTY